MSRKGICSILSTAIKTDQLQAQFSPPRPISSQRAAAIRKSWSGNLISILSIASILMIYVRWINTALGKREYNVIHTEPGHKNFRTASPVVKTVIQSSGPHTMHLKHSSSGLVGASSHQKHQSSGLVGASTHQKHQSSAGISGASSNQKHPNSGLVGAANPEIIQVGPSLVSENVKIQFTPESNTEWIHAWFRIRYIKTPYSIRSWPACTDPDTHSSSNGCFDADDEYNWSIILLNLEPSYN